ncbi:methyltransferase domain-containing protein [Thermosulfurimonas sp.]|uniref:class I SAM-dependent methyltransferase n=1 Tax=Thermosulfurimonas sp. TaxID=2080236 RepID=UPI0025EECB45|nr:methyltransferase domain-containing protein [Thermosulfurimonas sp.]
MAHRFDPREKHKLESPERRRHLPPERVLELLELKPGETLLDLGCGTGYFALPAAQRVGPSGRVFAVDVEEEMLAEVRKKASGIPQIELIRSETYRVPLPQAVAEAALLAFVLHEVEDPVRLLGEVRRLLKPGGRLLVLEWQKKETPMGPPVSERLTEEETRAFLKEAGFAALETSPFGDWFYTARGFKPA